MTLTQHPRVTPAVRTTVRATLLAALALAACRTDRTGVDPELPGNPSSNPQLRSAAFIFDVNTRAKTVKVISPTAPTGSVSVNGRAPSFSVSGIPGPMFSIVAGDVVELTTANFAASAVGQYTPGQVRVTFDVFISNRLGGVELITSTFPAPPAGTNGIVLFPFENVVTVTSGGTSTSGDGTDIIVELPSHGGIAPSVDWDGSPHNFFNDTGCPAGSNDCFRHQVFAQPLAPGATSEAQSVGFDMDPTVGNFRARLIVVANLANAGAAPVGTVVGNVTSPERGALSGVTVTVNTGGFTGTTNGGGAYSIPNVTTGSKTVSLSNLPSGCTNPGSQNTTVSSGGTATVNFSVTCTVPAGTVGGTITSSLGGGISGVSITVTPTGGAAQPVVSTNASGVYSRTGVPVGGTGTGSVALSNLPALCTNPGATPYSGLTDAGSVTVDITVTCSAPPAGYQYTSTWGAPAGGQVTLTISLDMGTFNDPAINGASPDDIDAIQGSVGYDGTRLQFVSGANVAGAGMQNITASDPAGGPFAVNFINFSTAPAGALHTGVQGVAVLTFNIIGGSGPTTTATALTIAASDTGADLLPNTIINEGTLP